MLVETPPTERQKTIYFELAKDRQGLLLLIAQRLYGKREEFAFGANQRRARQDIVNEVLQVRESGETFQIPEEDQREEIGTLHDFLVFHAEKQVAFGRNEREKIEKRWRTKPKIIYASDSVPLRPIKLAFDDGKIIVNEIVGALAPVVFPRPTSPETEVGAPASDPSRK